MANWYYRIRNEEFGPVADLGLAALFADGSLHATDEVRRDGEQEWRPASAALASYVARAEAEQEWAESDLDNLLVAESPATASRSRNSTGVATIQVDDESDVLLDDPSIAGADDLNMLAAEEPTTPRRVRPVAPAAAPSESGEDGSGWYYKSLGQELGPVSYDEILRLAGDGELTPNDFVRPGTDGAWQRAGRISGLFPDNYLETQARLKEAAAKMAVSSQRLGEKGLAALSAELEKLKERGETTEEEPSSRKSAKLKKKGKGTRPKIKDVEDYAASILSEETEEEAPKARSRPEPRSSAPAVDATAESDAPTTDTRPLNTVQTPLPPTRSFTPPAATAPPVSAFKRAPAKKASSGGGGGFRLPFDPKQAMMVGGVLLALLAGYFLPWKSVLGLGDGPAPNIYNQAVFMWGKIRALHEDKRTKQADWEMLESELSASINRHMSELKGYAGRSELSAKLIAFEECLTEFLSKGKNAPPELYAKTEAALKAAKAAMPKKK